MYISKRNSTCIKGFAALCIVMHHFYTNGCVQGGKVLSIALGNLGSCNVVLFLTLAGYGAYISYTTSSMEGRGKYILKRLTKIYIPYLLVTAVWSIYFFRNACTVGMSSGILMNFFGITINNNGLSDFTMWYMTFMFFWYIIFGFIMYFKINDKIKITILFMIACYLHIYWGEWIPDLSMLMRMSAFGFPCGVLFAYMSLNCKKYREITQNTILQFLVGVGCFSLFVYMYIFYDFNADIYAINSLLYSVGVIFIFNAIETIYKCRALYFLGGIIHDVFTSYENNTFYTGMLGRKLDVTPNGCSINNNYSCKLGNEQFGEANYRMKNCRQIVSCF